MVVPPINACCRTQSVSFLHQLTDTGSTSVKGLSQRIVHTLLPQCFCKWQYLLSSTRGRAGLSVSLLEVDSVEHALHSSSHEFDLVDLGQSAWVARYASMHDLPSLRPTSISAVMLTAVPMVVKGSAMILDHRKYKVGNGSRPVAGFVGSFVGKVKEQLGVRKRRTTGCNHEPRPQQGACISPGVTGLARLIGREIDM